MNSFAYNKYHLHLDEFEGPIELLLYFIRKGGIDIMNIPISQIAEDFYQYTKKITITPEEYAEFLVMAASLLRLKIKALLRESLKEEFPEEDSKITLARIIEEFANYKEAAQFLRTRELENLRLFPRCSSNSPSKTESKEDPSILFLHMLSLLEKNKKEIFFIEEDEWKLEEAFLEIKKELKEKKRISFLNDMLTNITGIKKLILLFMAILELVKMGEIRLYQKDHFEDIILVANDR